MVRYFGDYQWSNQTPVGVNELGDLPEGKSYFKFIKCDNGVCVEQYDHESGFVRLCHHPNDIGFNSDWQKELFSDNMSAVVRDAGGFVVRYEKYDLLNELCADVQLVHAKIFNVEGRLLETHEARKVSDTEYDLHVKDACGKPKGVIHHSGVDKGEPYTICEEWIV